MTLTNHSYLVGHVIVTAKSLITDSRLSVDHTPLQDLLMVVYLADLTKTQMVLGERLSQLKS